MKTTTKLNRICWLVSLLLTVALLPRPALAQSRREVTIRRNRAVGWGPSRRHDYYVNRYSTGLSSLNVGYKPADGSGPLGSSIYRKQSMAIRRSGAGAGSAYSTRRYTPSKAPKPRRMYAPVRASIPSVSAPVRPYRGTVGTYVPSGTVSAGSDYMSVGAARPKKLPKELLEEVITSLVPKPPAKHRDEMIKGEQAFRKGKYAEALAHFETARQLSSDSPESLLSLARASFALAEGSYAKTAEYLLRTLEIVPELPLVHVFPRSFYGQADDYRRHSKNLADYAKSKPDDAQAQFLLGYLRWRQGKADEARAALGRALARAGERRLTKTIKTLLSGIAAAEQSAWGQPPKMAKPIECPAAGIRMALPEGFKSMPLSRMRHVLQAARTGDGGPMDVTLAAFPVGEGVTPTDILEYVMGYWRKSPAVDELAIIEEREVTVAGLPAVGRLFGYSVRGKEARAVGVCFVRDVKPSEPGAKPVRIGYGLLVKARPNQTAAMIGVINGVAQSVALTELRRPIDLPVELTDHVVTDLEGRYSLRLPKGWTFGHDEMGVVMGRMDHLLGGVSSPAVRIVTAEAPEGMTAKACGESAVKHAEETQGCDVKILSQGPAKLGSLPGYQFVVRKRQPLEPAKETPAGDEADKPATFGEPFIEVGRMVNLPARDGQQRFYVVIVTCYGADAKQAQAVMDQLAPGFRLRPRVLGR